MNGYILFLGSGSKDGVPNLEHMFKNIENRNKGIDPFCEICNESINANNKNVRNPFSVIINSPQDQHQDTFLFEMGPTFRTSMIEYAIPANINKVDRIFCMGSNEASFNGIDETREVQKYERPVSDDGIVYYLPTIRVPTYLTSSAVHALNDWYRYIINYSLKDELKSKTKVGCIQLNILDPRHSPNTLILDSITAFDDYINSNKDFEVIQTTDKNSTFYPIIIQNSKEVKITSFFFIDCDNKLCSGYLVEYISCQTSICIIPTYSVIPKETLEFLKAIPIINILISPITPSDSFINSELITDSVHFCANVVNAKHVYFYNINCNHSHELFQEIVNKNASKFPHIKFNVSFDSQLIPINQEN